MAARRRCAALPRSLLRAAESFAVAQLAYASSPSPVGGFVVSLLGLYQQQTTTFARPDLLINQSTFRTLGLLPGSTTQAGRFESSGSIIRVPARLAPCLLAAARLVSYPCASPRHRHASCSCSACHLTWGSILAGAAGPGAFGAQAAAALQHCCALTGCPPVVQAQLRQPNVSIVGRAAVDTKGPVVQDVNFSVIFVGERAAVLRGGAALLAACCSVCRAAVDLQSAQGSPDLGQLQGQQQQHH